MSTKKADHEKLMSVSPSGSQYRESYSAAHLSAAIAWVACPLFTERTEEPNETAQATQLPG